MVASLYVFLLSVLFMICASASTGTSTHNPGLNWTFGLSVVNDFKNAWLDFIAPKIHNIPVLPVLENEPFPGLHIKMTNITLASIGLDSNFVDIDIKKNSTVSGANSLDIGITNMYLNLTFGIELQIGKGKPHVGTGWFDFDEGATLDLVIAPKEYDDYWGLDDYYVDFNPGGFKLHTTNKVITTLLGLSKKLVTKLVGSTMEGQVGGLFKKLVPIWEKVLPAIHLTDSIGFDLAFAAMPEFDAESQAIIGSHVAEFVDLPGKTDPPVPATPKMPLTIPNSSPLQLFVDQSLLNSAFYLLNESGLITGYIDQALLSKIPGQLPISLTAEGIRVLFPDIASRMTPKCGVSIALKTIDPYPLVGLLAGNTIFNLNLNLEVYGGTIPLKQITDPKLCLADKTCVLMSSMDISLELGLTADADVSGPSSKALLIQVMAVQVNSLVKSPVNPVPGDNSNFPQIEKALNGFLGVLTPQINTTLQERVDTLLSYLAPLTVLCGISLESLTLDATYGYASILAEPKFVTPPDYEECLKSLLHAKVDVPRIIMGDYNTGEPDGPSGSSSPAALASDLETYLTFLAQEVKDDCRGKCLTNRRDLAILEREKCSSCVV